MNATFWEHIEELRAVAIRSLAGIAIGISIAFLFYYEIIHFLLIPLEKSEIDVELVLLTPLDGISASFKIAFWVGTLIAAPFWSYQILRFLMPALNTRELGLLLPFIALSMFFLTLGFLFAFFISIPLSNHYLYNFNQAIGKNMWSLAEYLNYTVAFLLAHCAAFQICVVLLFLVHFRVVSVETMASKRRHIAVGAFMLGAVLTPPDVLSQIILSSILLVIYEMAILYGKLRRKRSQEAESSL